MVFSGLVIACRLATWPTSRSPPLVMPTTEGVVRAPSWFGMTTGSPPCITATTELVVPRSMPIILLMEMLLSGQNCFIFSIIHADKPLCYMLSVSLSSYLCVSIICCSCSTYDRYFARNIRRAHSGLPMTRADQDRKPCIGRRHHNCSDSRDCCRIRMNGQHAAESSAIRATIGAIRSDSFGGGIVESS